MGLVKRTYVDGETVITADNLNDIQDEIIQNASDISTKGTYSKPSGGIPSTDMTTAVQTSLGKADTAYQKPSGGIPSTDLASAVQTSLGKADTAYQKPSGGIPSTDLASAVQTSLGKADTALQSSDIDSTLTVAGKVADAKATGDEISGVKNTLNSVGNGIALENSGNTAQTAIAEGFLVYVKNHSTLPEGVYQVSTTSGTGIAAGTTLSSSNLAQPSAFLNVKTIDTGITGVSASKFGFFANLYGTNNPTGWSVPAGLYLMLGTLPSSLKSRNTLCFGVAINATNRAMCSVVVSSNGELYLQSNVAMTVNYFSITYISNH